jgi:hypothetical protein
MARSKSTSSGKGNRKNASLNQEAVGAGSPEGTAETDARFAAGATGAETAAGAMTGHEGKVTPVAKIAEETRKLEVVKSEPRKKVVVPINLEDEIRRRAYEIYQQRGNAPGSESDDWLLAEREVRQRYHHQQQHTA